jgi:glycosyltransferase involved in cell wall biosynthesis
LKKQRKMLYQERLRQIAWEVGHKYPIPLTCDYIALSMINPRLGYVHWHIRKESAETLWPNEAFNNATLVVRVYDVTDIIFNGINAHMFFDLQVGGLTGNYYFRVDHLARNYLAEVGLRSRDGFFHSLARSNTTFFDSDRPSGNYQIAGLFAGGALNRVFPVENIFDAPVYERMNRELAGIERQEALFVAMVFLGIDGTTVFNTSLSSFIRNFSQMFRRFGGKVQLFLPLLKEAGEIVDESLMEKIDVFSEGFYKQLSAIHKKTPFHLIHCHGWYSSAVGSTAAKELNLPVILSLHSTEYERTQGNKMDSFSSTVCERERKGVQEAALVIVPHSSTRQQVINLYDASPEKVVIIPDVLIERPPGIPADAAEIKQLFSLNPNAPMVLFAGDISHAAGADLMVDALPTVCRNHRTVQFVFAGDGPLKGELEARAWHNGIGHRCRFLGDVSRETFETLLNASDFVVIPARTWQDEGLAKMAIGCGRPVLTTRQAGINCVVHGENGLVTFDNPGSIVWGIQELLFKPLQGSMLRLVAKKNAGKTPSLESIAVQHYTYYEMVLKSIQGAKNA